MADGAMVGPMDKSQSKPQANAAQQVSPRWKGSARYRIVVGKQLSPTWSDRLAGMEITTGEEHPSQAMVTRLEGVIQDQAQLSGLLNALYDMGLPLLSVETLED